MKKKLLLLFILFSSTAIIAQVNPTLAVGLEKLTMNKGTIDVEVLTEIIMSKQKELKQEALRRFMFKLFPEANFTTKYYVQNCLNVLLNEKNPQVIEKEILELTTNYALSLGVAYALLRSPEQEILNTNAAYVNYKIYSPYYQDMIIKEKENKFKKESRIQVLKDSIIRFENDVDVILAKIDKAEKKNIRDLVSNKKKVVKFKNKLARLNLRKNITSNDDVIINEKEYESLELINRFSLSDEIMKIDSSLSYLCKVQNYIIKNNNDKSILSLYNYLKEIDASLIELKTLINKKEKFGIEEGDKKEENEIKIKDEQNDLKHKVQSLNKQYLEIPLEIPFGIVLDVVSLSLSDIPELQKKGFFKNKVDYRSSEFYLDLINNGKTDGRSIEKKGCAKILRASLDNMKLHVCKKITPYVRNYDIVNEFLKKSKGKQVDDIIKDLQDESIVFISSDMINEEWLVDYPKIKNILSATKVLEQRTKILEAGMVSVISKKNNLLDCKDICDKIIVSAYRESIDFQKTLKEFRDGLPVEDSDIRESVENIIKLNPNVFFDFPTIEVKKLSEITTNDIESDAEKKTINKSILQINNKISLITSSNRRVLIPEILNEVADLENHINKLPNGMAVVEDVKISDLIKAEFIKVDKEKLNQQIGLVNNAVGDLEKKMKNKIDLIVKEIKKKYKIIADSDDFYNRYLTSVLDEMENEHKPFNTESLDTLTISKASAILPKIYSKVKSLINNHDVHMSDIVYLEDYITDKMIELKIRDKNNDELYTSIIAHTKLIIPLLKIRALENIKDMGRYDQELMDLFEFISNLNKLDEAETYQSIVNMLRDGSKKVEENLIAGEFKDSYILFINAMKKYTLINPSEEYVEIDVVSFLTELQQYYNRNNKAVFSLYLSLGLDQNFFFKNFRISETETINNISFASEKIGVKWRIANFKRFEGYENVIKDDVYLNKKAPFINELYGIVYGSGLLYTLANTTTNENFDFPHVGMGVGMRFYNALDVNLILGFPFVKNYNFGDNAFYGIGLDIPLGEYLEKLGSKNK